MTAARKTKGSVGKWADELRKEVAIRARPRKQLEHTEQALLVKWLEAQGIGFFAVPNEHSPKRLGRLKARGLKAGAPDIVLHRTTSEQKGHKPATHSCNDGPGTGTMASAEYCGAWCWRVHPVAIELKSKSGKLSEAQVATHEAMRREGWVVVVAFGFDDAVRQLVALGIGR